MRSAKTTFLPRDLGYATFDMLRNASTITTGSAKLYGMRATMRSASDCYR